jgi:hypothetical protein
MNYVKVRQKCWIGIVAVSTNVSHWSLGAIEQLIRAVLVETIADFNTGVLLF